jgi:hypothetical protein
MVFLGNICINTLHEGDNVVDDDDDDDDDDKACSVVGIVTFSGPINSPEIF